MTTDRLTRGAGTHGLLASALAAAFLAACGGGGGGGGTAAAPAGPATVLSGVAVDGYLKGATVFLDLNGNGLQDAGEPSAVTNDSGRYSLSYSGLADSVAGKMIVVTGGIDTDTGYAFGGRLTTRAEQAASGQVVSPLTTLVDALVAQGLTIDAARSRLAAALGLSVTDLATDPLAALANQPAIYTQQVALQRSIQLLATANTGDGDSAYAAQRRIVDALAVAIKSGTGQVSVGTLVSQINATNTAAGRQLADAVHDALEAALRTPGGHQSAKAVLKAMDQMRTRMENTRNYNLGTTASQLDTEHGTTAFARLTNSDHSDDDDAINSVTRQLGSTTSAISQPANSSGRLLASNCFQCHGTGGVGGFESIRGSDAAEVKEYLGKPAGDDIMAAHAQGYTSAQLDAIIAYLKQ